MHLRLGHRPEPRWRSLQRSPRSPSWWGGGLLPHPKNPSPLSAFVLKCTPRQIPGYTAGPSASRFIERPGCRRREHNDRAATRSRRVSAVTLRYCRRQSLLSQTVAGFDAVQTDTVIRDGRIELLLLEYSVVYLIEYSSTRQGK